MRLNRLDLTRYGKFTDQSINLDKRKAGEPDFHIVYGPNEAGKSTALAAFLDLLFGIETRSRFNFLHPYPTMRIGASLDLAGGAHELFRVKRPQNSLLDSSERPISEGAILAELGGIGRDSYRMMFSLDDDTLEAGGESILASKGDLGQLLFSASAGLADLSHGLGDLRSEADGFYKYRARTGELSDLKARLAALKEERERIDTAAAQYAQFVEVRDQTGFQYREAITDRSQIQSRIDEIQRLLNAQPRLAALRGFRERLAALSDLPDAPLGWSEALPKLQLDEVELATRAEGVADEVAQLSAELDALVVDEAAVAMTDKVERLADLRARHITAEKDIPERRVQLREAQFAISGILSRIEREAETEPMRLVLGASVVGVLRGLIETRSGIEAAAKSADDELLEAKRRLEEAKAKLDEMDCRDSVGQGGDGAPISSLVAILAELRADDHAARARLAARSRATHLDTLADRLRELRPWAGTIDELVDMMAPEAGRIESWKIATTQAQIQIDRQMGEVERLTTDRIRLTAEIDAIGSVVGVVSDEEAGRVRATREQAWANHRRALDATSADAFEHVLRQDDIVASARLGHAGDVARLHQTTQALIVLEAGLGRADRLKAEAETALQRVREEIVVALRAMTPALPADMALSELEAWLGRRLKALEVRTALHSAERDLLEAEADAQMAQSRLKVALVATGVTHTAEAKLETLILTAQAAIDREAELKGFRDAVAERQRELKNRVRDAESAAAADQAWTAAWGRACSSCWLGEPAETPALGTVREILTVVTALGPALEKQAGLADRIGKMERDQADFAVEVAVIARELGLRSSTGAVLDIARAISDCVQNANAKKGKRAEKERNLERTGEKQRSLAEALGIHAKRKAEMTSFFGVSSLAEVGTKLQGVARKAELDEQADTARRDILESLRSPSLEEAERALDSADQVALETEISELKARFDDQDQRSRDLFSTHSKAIDRLEAVGGDDAVAKIEEQRRTLCLGIEDKALRYLRVRVGTAAAEQALRAYRDRHRSSMMARASEAFHTVSRGAYTGLTTQPDKDSEILIALNADGGSKVASELSKGTRFQLYLALRVAGYHEFARSRRPVPFIADDIMETFDDFRAEEAFRLFAEMAEVGQVIYLTHHRHLCEIAQRICPTAQMHRLG